MDPRTAQPVASRCTDYVIPARSSKIYLTVSFSGWVITYKCHYLGLPHRDLRIEFLGSYVKFKNRFMQFICLAVVLGRQRNVDLFQNVLVHSVTI